ncbi:MAG: folylpolyglutamate synthase/dihydrofolate synthase family protein [Desulfobacterium sp.]|jgi:dihydrofolate synthase/folylpolyglutamate synthase|nr:folylpolyglutamate synthase/dihydrofolate synthase family protein [Desulfobacterium sp.]
MNQISYEECLERMYGLGRFGIKLGLDTISEILTNLDSPEKSFKSIHIAGTNGKGSIASYIAEILKAAGFKVGLYTSPHLVRFNERFVINGIEVADDEMVQAYLAVNQADTAERKATFFELATAMAFYLFDRHGVEWAVIETGMGGRLDATNILSPELSVISNLSIEHTEYLGTTLEEIAMEKGGIIKHSTPAVTGVTQQNALKVLTSIARDKLAPLYLLDTDFHTDQEPDTNRFTYAGIERTIPGVETRLPGRHQLNNAAIAIAAVELLFPSPKNTPPVLPDQIILEGIFNTRWPGRLETVMESPLVVIDGAHNLGAAVNLARYLKENLSHNKLTLVLGILDDKDFISMLQHFVPLAHRIIFTRADNTRSIDPQILAQTARNIFTGEIRVIDKVGDAVAYAISTTSARDSICIAGSLYVAGEARNKIFSDILC